MTLLPIVERELRLAARQWSSFWIRLVSALVTMVIASLFLGFTMLGLVSPAEVGKALFAVLTWLVFLPLGFAGVFFTSDCVSEEKREGTLGLLFLTDLRGYDVVLGKLAASSVRSAYGLLATFPILALPLLMGGVTGGQFWRTILALLNALFFSLAAGLFVSTVTREGRPALGRTFALVLLANGLPLAVDGLRAAGTATGAFAPEFSLVSPAWCFIAAGTRPNAFWPAWETGLLLSAWLLAVSCVVLPRTWQERSRRDAGDSRSWLYRLQFGSETWRARQRMKFLSRNPVEWFCLRRRWQGLAWQVLVGGLLLAAVGVLCWSFLVPPSQARALRGGLAGAGLGVVLVLAIALNLWVAAEAPRFFVEARRSGALELFLATPLGAGEMVAGHWRALVRLIAGPMVLLAGLQLLTGVVQGLALDAEMALMSGMFFMPGVGVVGSVVTVIARAADLAALVWMGAWMGLASKNANLAALKTLLLVQVVPYVGSIFVAPMVFLPLALLGAAGGADQRFLWIPGLLSGMLWVLKDALFIAWARSRLATDFRALAAPPQPPRAPIARAGTPPPLIPIH